MRAVNEIPDYLVENHIGLRGDAGYSAFTFEDASTAGDQITLVADNDQEAAAETMVTGTTAAPSVIFGRPKGSTPAHSRDLKQRIRLLAIAEDAAK